MAEQGILQTQIEIGSPLTAKSAKARTTTEDSGRPGKRPRLQTPPRMTAAAALSESEQQRLSPAPSVLQSPNPQVAALSALMGINQNQTSPVSQDAKTNPATVMSQPLSVVAENLQGGTDHHVSPDNISLVSPVTSIGTVGSLMNASSQVTAMASPQPIDSTTKSSGESVSPQDPNKTVSYPQPFLTPQADAARRGMSLPGSNIRTGTRSPSNKKHKCPYCSTEFTRHHNLKSHLLTHSQEKPYVCSTCHSRFRRLHDLKRHTKLHTGERPHVCPKCNRKFARGDALARHNKGPGGCAGRRASMGSFGGDDDIEGDETMDGVVYGEPENIDDEEHLRGTPQIRRHPPSGDDSMDNSGGYRIPSTYPPIQGRPPGSFPPPGYPSSVQQVAVQLYHNGPGSSKQRSSGQVFAHNPMTESPQPIPMGVQQRQNTGTMDSIGGTRSPSSAQFTFPPRGSSGANSLTVPPHGPQLPPPHGLNPPDSRFTLPSQAGPTHPPTQPSGPPTHMSGSGPLSSHSNSSSHGFPGHSGEGHKGGFPTNEERLWAVVRSMEQQMGNMREMIDTLRGELGSLRQAFEQQRS